MSECVKQYVSSHLELMQLTPLTPPRENLTIS
jgi:hypothetical protein